MTEYVAKLTGEEDGYTVSRTFRDEGSAIAWLKGDGLAEFDDQQATGEVFDADGHLVWQQPHLETIESRDRERTRVAARHGMVVRPMRGGGGYRWVPLRKKTES